jgi:hypothetical protein
MTVFAGAVDATFTPFGIEAVYMPADGDPVGVRVIVRRPDTIVGFGESVSMLRRRPSRCRRVRSQIRIQAISSPWAARLSSSRASRSGAIPTS